ncbi:unnamed protein product [Prorocentrum cordatum]|uniref:Uncharacterized protein n=1 Tax=Prorocentrum cordatum TaxID=2364126 RepID=A0ABN9VRZ6_9DINO|nr:unnamed protein product [Polarella glacialis]
MRTELPGGVLMTFSVLICTSGRAKQRARGAGRLSEREACTACEEQARSRGRAGDASTPRGRMASARPKGPRRAAAGAPGARPARPAGAACVEALGHARPGPPGGGCRGGGGTCPT